MSPFVWLPLSEVPINILSFIQSVHYFLSNKRIDVVDMSSLFGHGNTLLYSIRTPTYLSTKQYAIIFRIKNYMPSMPYFC